MKLKLPQQATPNRVRPLTPTVVLTNEAYDALLDMSNKHDVSMRQLASAIIIQSAKEGIEIDADE